MKNAMALYQSAGKHTIFLSFFCSFGKNDVTLPPIWQQSTLCARESGERPELFLQL